MTYKVRRGHFRKSRNLHSGRNESESLEISIISTSRPLSTSVVIDSSATDPDHLNDEGAESEEENCLNIEKTLISTLLVCILGIAFPTLDLYKDVRVVIVTMVTYPQYWQFGTFLLMTNIINFFFTCFTWWRLETRLNKYWSWILLLLQLWPQFEAVKVLWLMWKGDKQAKQEKLKLDREVGGLEPFLESLPSVFIVYYFSHFRYSNPELWTLIGGWWSFYIPLGTSCLLMAKFLTSGPCFILPQKGPLSGFGTWRFFTTWLALVFTVYSKLFLLNFYPTYFLKNICYISLLSLLLALIAFHLASGLTNWKLILKYPAILLLPMFSYFTFGPIESPHGNISEVGLVLSWKWTLGNIFMSLLWFFGKAIFIQIPIYQLVSLCNWVVYDPPRPHTYFDSFFFLACFYLYFSILLTMMLPMVADLQYGVLIPNQHTNQYVLKGGQVILLSRPCAKTTTFESLFRKAARILGIILCLVTLYYLFMIADQILELIPASLLFSYQDYLNGQTDIFGKTLLAAKQWKQCYH